MPFCQFEVMPFPILTPVEREEAMAGASSDLKFHCAEMSAPIEWQEVIFHLGFNSMSLFATMDRSEEGLCRFLKEELELDEEDREMVSMVLEEHHGLFAAFVKNKMSKKG